MKALNRIIYKKIQPIQVFNPIKDRLNVNSNVDCVILAESGATFEQLLKSMDLKNEVVVKKRTILLTPSGRSDLSHDNNYLHGPL